MLRANPKLSQIGPMAMWALLCLTLVSCNDVFGPKQTSTAEVDAQKAEKKILEKKEDPYGLLFEAGWLGKVRIFYDPSADYGLVLYWIPKVQTISPGKPLNKDFCPTPDGFQYDASWHVPLQVSMYDATHDWRNPVAEFFPESEQGKSADGAQISRCHSPKDNPSPCSAFLLYDPNFENRKNFKYHNIQPGSKLVVLVSQPTLRAVEIDTRAGGLQMFAEMPGIELMPMCLAMRPNDAEAQKKDELVQHEYLYPKEHPANAPPLYRFTLNMYYQIEDCQNWYATAGLIPIEINLSQEIVKPLPEDVRALSYHPQVSGALCEMLSKAGGS